MPTVEFHILSEAGEAARLRHTCQLIDASYAQGKRVAVQVSDSGEAQKLDDMLWTFHDQAFIPHEIATPSSPSHTRIMALIGTTLPATFSNQLINTGPSVPENLESIEHLVEVVDADTQRKQLARERYKQYRERGWQLETKNI